jgi:hypothetical protein
MFRQNLNKIDGQTKCLKVKNDTFLDGGGMLLPK